MELIFDPQICYALCRGFTGKGPVTLLRIVLAYSSV
jgi:hypothetical protein